MSTAVQLELHSTLVEISTKRRYLCKVPSTDRWYVRARSQSQHLKQSVSHQSSLLLYCIEIQKPTASPTQGPSSVTTMPLLQWGRPRPAQVVHAAPQRGGLCAALAEVERRHVTRCVVGQTFGVAAEWATPADWMPQIWRNKLDVARGKLYR